MSFNSFKQTISAKSPELCIAAGIIGFVVTTVLAVKATPKAMKAREEVEEIKETIDEAHKSGETASDELDENGNSKMVPYTEEDYHNDMKLYIGKKIVYETKPYILPAFTGAASIALILLGFGILKKRHAAALSLLATTKALFSDYRSRVRADVGNEKDREYLTGIKTTKETVTVVDAEGNESEVEVEKTTQLDSSIGNCPWLSPYAVKLTADNCTQFKRLSGDKIYVAHWLETIQEMCNNHLHTEGIVYLDWVLEQLGVSLDPETNPAIDTFIAHNVGWIDTDFFYDSYLKGTFTNSGDRFVDFGCWDDQGELTITRGKDGEVYLDFNVDGWINGRIPKKHASFVHDQVEKYPEIEK